MNLLDLKTLDWSQSCLDACGPNLRDLLGPPIASTKSLGSISNYMVERFGFDDNCLVSGKIKDFLTHLGGVRAMLCHSHITLCGTSLLHTERT